MTIDIEQKPDLNPTNHVRFLRLLQHHKLFLSKTYNFHTIECQVDGILAMFHRFFFSLKFSYCCTKLIAKDNAYTSLLWCSYGEMNTTGRWSAGIYCSNWYLSSKFDGIRNPITSIIFMIAPVHPVPINWVNFQYFFFLVFTFKKNCQLQILSLKNKNNNSNIYFIKF